MPNHLHIDAFSGIAGDMFLGAMIDLGVEIDQLRAALNPLPIALPYQLTAARVQRCGIGAVDLKVAGTPGEPEKRAHKDDPDAHKNDPQHDDSDPERHDHAHKHGHAHTHHHDHPHDHAHSHEHGHNHDHAHSHDHSHTHVHTGYRDIMEMVAQLDTTDRGRQRAGRIVTVLAQAEARVHGKSLDDVHFHEVGAVDSIIDMLGAAVALEILEIDSVSAGPLPLSRGFVRCAHGVMPVPAPATAYLLEGMPTVGVDRTGELITPTGAAIVAAVADAFGPPPAMRLARVGYGAGDREDPQIPNLLRLMTGTTLERGDLGPTRVHAATDSAAQPA